MTMIHVPGCPVGTWRLLAFLLCTLGPWGGIAAGTSAAEPMQRSVADRPGAV